VLPAETSKLAEPRGGHAAEKWLPLIEGFVERLGAAAQPDLAAALAFLASGLEASGAYAVELEPGREPLVWAGYGEIDWAPVGAQPLRGDAGRPGSFELRRFGDQAQPGLCAAIYSPATANPIALILGGNLEDNAATESSLRTLLRLIDRLRPRPAVRAPAPGDTASLVLPPGHVRGEAPSMQALYGQLQPVARSDLPILIRGETGVGKEHAARILHESSNRRRQPFVAVNCAAVPGELLEAEFFGICKGVATGVEARRGKFQHAHGGTLFLDEIGDMSKPLQAKLLRAVQEQEIHPLGGSPIPIDVRLIAATNTEIEQRITAGTFRQDLYYRLAGFVVRVPPLRERREDIPALVEEFLRTCSREAGKSIRGITIGALRQLISRPWPGNVRELKHEVHRLVYACPDRQAVDSSMLSETALCSPETAFEEPEAAVAADPGSPDADLRLEGVSDLDLAGIERRTIAEALRRCGDNRTRAAELLGLSREALRRRMARHGLGHRESGRNSR
ncbi:MAG: sigma-54-dependent Fis family transcriptional regulator, partial [bacterium]|nr:sigma-54-dependent Fis family transcriptional regulator [bacterium]